MDPRIAAIVARGRDPLPSSGNKGMDFISGRMLAKAPEKRTEIQRICKLPISEPLDDDEYEAVNAMHVKPEAPADFKLERSQAEALYAYSLHGGLFAPLPVGSGKTLISLRCVGIAFENGITRAVLFVPPQVYSQLVNRDIAWTRRRVPLGCSFYLMGGLNAAKRKQLSGAGRQGCWIFPYSLLSRPDSYENLEAIRPELVIFDEAHNLKNRSAARTKRILTYYRKYRPQVVCLSGTMTKKSLNDYAHLVTMCLKESAPVPLEANVVQEWAATLDSTQRQTESHHVRNTGPGPLRPLIAWSNHHFPATKLEFDVQGFRMAFQNRLLTAPGVVTSTGESLGTSLIVQNRKVKHMEAEGGAELDRLTHQLNDTWTTPSGDELEHAMLVWKWNYELTAGIYNALEWPTVEDLIVKRGLREHEATQILEESKRYHEALQEYHRELRAWFRTHAHRPGLDTPMLVAASMARYEDRDVGKKLYAAWSHKNELDFRQRVERVTFPVRVCDYKVREAAKWAAGQEDGGIVWYENREVGHWIVDVMKELDVPHIHCPAGKAVDRMLTAENVADLTRGKTLVCSLSAHGTGKNLQFKTDQLFVQLPITETEAEQAIGRTHRKGQDADEITVTTLVSNVYDEMCLAALLNDAIYVRETMNDARKLLIATWDPMPIIYGSQVLLRAGAQAKLLNARQQIMLQERFTKDKNP